MNAGCWTHLLKVRQKQGNFGMPLPSCPQATKRLHPTPFPLLFSFPVICYLHIRIIIFPH